MRVWPDFDNNGDLPVGIHRATLAEVIEHFGGGSLQRRIVAQRLTRIYDLASGTGHLARFIIFGSFVTSKPEPNDVDIFLLMEESFVPRQVSDEAEIVFSHLAAQEYEGASVFWLKRSGAIGGEQSALVSMRRGLTPTDENKASNGINNLALIFIAEDWQIKRDKTRRGIVEVMSHD